MKRIRADHRNHCLFLEPLEKRLLLTASELPNDVDTTLLLHLNGNSTGASGETPAVELGLTYPAGLINQAMHVDNPGTLRYATAGNIVGSEGTVEFWIKPDWNGNTNSNFAFFEVGDNFDNGMLMALDSANNLRFIQWGDDPTTGPVESDVERGVGAAGDSLLADNWYHVAVTWNGATGEMAYYVDGQLVTSANDGVQIANFSTSYLAIGSEVDDQNSAQAAFDEFRISSRARTAGEILADYNAGLGIVLNGEIHGAVFYDDPSLPPLPGWVVFLDQNNNGQLDDGEDFSISDSAGQYAFTDLTPNITYIVRVVAQFPIWLANPFNQSVPLGNGQIVNGVDFVILHVPPGADQMHMLGSVFLDANGNGVQEAGEPGLAGWTVFMDTNDDSVLNEGEPSQSTGSSGSYDLLVNPTFSPPGAVNTYRLRIVPQSGKVQTTPIDNMLNALPAISTGVQPQQGGLGDFNLDEFPDLIVPNSGSDSLTILTNNGSGSLGASQTIDLAPAGGVIGRRPAATAVADFNHDNKPDIAVANTNTNNVAILRNTTAVPGATPTFQITTVSTGTANGPAGIAAADFNGDDYADLAVTDQYSSKVSIFLNVGAANPGAFTLFATVAVGHYPIGITAIQLNDDNYVDLAVANYVDNTITLLTNNGAGAFSGAGTLQVLGNQPAAIVSADFNQDGRTDLATANLTTGTLSVCLATGIATFSMANLYPITGTLNPASLVAADLDNDGDTDLVVSAGATSASATINILHNRGDGTFVPVKATTLGTIPAAGIAPASGDQSAPDSGPSDQDVVVIAPGEVNPTGAVFVVAGNLDNDIQSTNDLIVINGLAGSTTVLSNTLISSGKYQLAIGFPDTASIYSNFNFGMQNVLSTVIGRRLFYNQSGTSGATVRYDGNNLAINSLDDNAIATDKVAYLPGAGTPATFANMSSFSKGINGIMIDISGSHPNIGIDDFEFHVGNNNSPSTWSALATAPTTVSVRPGGTHSGPSGSDRIEIIWNSGAAFRQWLEVIVLANADTGLVEFGGAYETNYDNAGDIFYFGNPVGGTGIGDSGVVNSTVNSTDESGARFNPAAVGTNIPITNPYDFNRDARVNATDEGISRFNATNSGTVLKYLNLASPPLAPEGGGGGGGGGDAGVASALTASAPASSPASVPRWLGLRLEEVDLNSGRIAELFQAMHDGNTPGLRKLLVKADRIADALGLDHELLDSLLADLGLE